MLKMLWLGAAALALCPSTLFAQDTGSGPPAAPTVEPTAAEGRGVLVYRPDFFASSRPSTALDMIARLPGFNLNTGNSGTRGFAGAAGNVLIDGSRPSSKSDSLDEILRRISAESVDRIELIRGGAPGIDMQGQSVVANVIVKRSAQVERVVETNFYAYPDGYIGPLLRGRYSRREGDNQLEAAVHATSDRTDGTSEGYRRRFDGSGALIQDARLDLWDRIRNADARGAVQRRVLGGKLRVNGLIGRNAQENSQLTDVFAGTGSDEFSERENISWNGEAGLNWTRRFGERTEVEVVGLQRYSVEEFTSDFESGGFTSAFNLDATSGESIGRTVLRFRPSDRWAFETGGELAYNFLDSSTAYAENGVAIPLPSSSVLVEELRGEVFGQGTWRPSPRFSVEAGARVEVSEISQSGDTEKSKSFVYPKPRVLVTWSPAEGHQFRFRTERTVSQLDFGDFVASAEIDIGQVEAGNPDLEPQKSTVFEVTYERRFWGEGVLLLLASHTIVQDVIDVIPLAGGFEAIGNIGDGESDFFQARLTLPLQRFGLTGARLQGRIGLNDSRVIDPLTGEERAFSGNAPFTCGVNYNHDLFGGRWGYGVDAGCTTVEYSQFRIRELRDNEEEPFVTLFGQWKPSPKLHVRVDLGNVTDRERRRSRFVHDGPRNTAPLRYREDQGTKMSPWLYLQIRKTL